MRDCMHPELERLTVESKIRCQRYGRRDLRRQVADCRDELAQIHRVLNRQQAEHQKELADLIGRLRLVEAERDRYKDELTEALEERRTEKQVARISKRLGKPISASDAH